MNIRTITLIDYDVIYSREYDVGIFKTEADAKSRRY